MAFLAPRNFEGGRQKKNAIFWSTFSKKCLKTFFFLACFFQNFGFGIKTLVKMWSFSRLIKIVIWESSENQFGRLKKKVVKILDFLLKLLPLEKILDPTLVNKVVAFKLCANRLSAPSAIFLHEFC